MILLILLRNLVLQHFDLCLEALVVIDQVGIGRHALLQIEGLFVHGVAICAIIPQFFLQLRDLNLLALDQLS